MGTPLLKFPSLSRQALWLLPPKLSSRQRTGVAQLKARIPSRAEMIWILSSGTQTVDVVKAIGLSREAVLASAKAVNEHLNSSASDIWSIEIPTYHIGGFAILARAQVSGARVIAGGSRWSAKEFVQRIGKNRVTLTSLVPTQVYDLVTAQLRAPECLRAIVVGGGALAPELYLKARALGWPLLPSYGLTECASQVATAPLASLSNVNEFPTLKPLKHVDVKLDSDGRIEIRSASLCEYIAIARDGEFTTLEDPRRAGWFPTEDRAEWSGRGLNVLGRADDIVKVLGVLVPLAQVEAEALPFFDGMIRMEDYTVVALPDPRQEHRLVLVTSSLESIKKVESCVSAYNRAAPGPRRLSSLIWVPEIPRTALGKVKRRELQRMLFT